MQAENIPHIQSDLPREMPVFSELWSRRAEVDELWNKGKEPFVRHGRTEENLLSHLMNAGVPLDKLGEIFTNRGEFRVKSESEFIYDQVSPKELYDHLIDRYQTIFSLINVSADQGYAGGFNNHGGEEHIIPVTNTAWELVKQAGGSSEEQKLVIAVGLSHDLGMLLTRKSHSLVSSRLAFSLAPELTQTPETAARIRRAVILHDEGVASMWMELLASKYGKDTNEFYAAVRNKFGVAALAVLAADKADVVDRRRATRKLGVDADILVNDAHTSTAVLADQRGYETTTVPGVPENKEIQMRILSFHPYLSEEETLQMYAAGSDKHKDEVLVPMEYRILNRENGYPHFFLWMADIWKYHTNRFGLETRALFSLFPKLDTYHLIIQDDSTWKNIGYMMSFTYEVNHAEVAEFTNFLSTEAAFPERKPRTEETIPRIYKEEAKRIRSMGIEKLVEDLQGNENFRIKRVLWRSLSGKSALIARYKFNTNRQPESIQAHVDKLFQPHKSRV